MKGQKETAAAVNDKQAVELIEENTELVAENGEPIPVELLAEPEYAEPEPPKLEVIEPPTEIIPEKTDLNSVLELTADPRVQYQDNYRKASEDIVSMSLNAAIVGGLCAFIHHGLTMQNTSEYLTLVVLFMSLVAFRLWYVHKTASKLAKTKITLTKDYVRASGPYANEDWKVHISHLDKATLISEAAKRKVLVLTTSSSSHTLRGLEEPEKLMLNLSKEIQVDTAALQQKLQEIADSILDCKDADEVEELRDTKQVQARVQKSLSEEFPEARVLQQDFSKVKSDTKMTLALVGIILIFACLGFSQYALPLLPIAIFTYLPGILSLRRTVDCLYVFTADALYEIDRKSGTVHTISLNRVVNRKHDSEDDVSLFIDNRVHLPVHIDKAEAEYIETCLKKYPSSETL